jgi:hypothetical protein
MGAVLRRGLTVGTAAQGSWPWPALSRSRPGAQWTTVLPAVGISASHPCSGVFEIHGDGNVADAAVRAHANPLAAHAGAFPRLYQWLRWAVGLSNGDIPALRQRPPGGPVPRGDIHPGGTRLR